MKTLSVRQPWAWLIVNGYKTVENRTWRTHHRGSLAIQAGTKIERDALQNIIDQYAEDGEPVTPEELAEMRTTGAIVGIVNVVDCTLDPTDENDIEWHAPGCWAWILRDPAQLEEPIPQKGRLGLFESDVEPDTGLGTC